MTNIEPLSYEYFVNIIQDESLYNTTLGRFISNTSNSTQAFCDKFQEWIDHQIQFIVSQTELQSSNQSTELAFMYQSYDRQSTLSDAVTKCAFLYATMIVRQHLAIEIAQRSLIKVLKFTSAHYNRPNKNNNCGVAEKCIITSFQMICEFLQELLTKLQPILSYFGISFLQLVLSHPRLGDWQYRKVLQDHIEVQLPATMLSSSGVNLRKLLSMSNKPFHVVQDNRLDATTKVTINCLVAK